MLKKLLPWYLILNTIPAIALNLQTEEDRMAYSLGCVAAEHIKSQEKIGIQLQQDIFIQGFKDAMDNKQILNQEQIIKELSSMKDKQIEQQKNSLQKTSSINLQKGQEFLAKNKKNKNIFELKNGLQYQVIHNGNQSAKSPTINDKVQVQYRGTLLDGTEFDSSYSRSEPATFELKSLIPGWQEALVLMKPNAKWKIFVPPQLAYGTEGAGAMIEPNAVLVFDIELVAVNPA